MVVLSILMALWKLRRGGSAKTNQGLDRSANDDDDDDDDDDNDDDDALRRGPGRNQARNLRKRADCATTIEASDLDDIEVDVDVDILRMNPRRLVL